MQVRLLTVLVALLLASCALFLTVGAKGDWSFVLQFRGLKLAALVLIGVAVSTATVLFQTVSGNRILTPSIMGFDALYVLMLTGSVFLFGGAGYLNLSDMAVFLINTGAMVAVAVILFGTLLVQSRQDLPRMILTGIILGVLFSSLTAFMQRLIDPNAFAIVQVNSYARFTRVNTDLLLIAACVLIPALGLTWGLRRQLDVLALGRDTAISLGESYKLVTLLALSLVAVLVSVSTALVGPIAFLGLLVVSLARAISPAPFHFILLPVSALIAAILLVAGQTITERVLGMATPLSVVIDFAGGLLFLVLLIWGRVQ